MLKKKEKKKVVERDYSRQGEHKGESVVSQRKGRKVRVMKYRDKWSSFPMRLEKTFCKPVGLAGHVKGLIPQAMGSS